MANPDDVQTRIENAYCRGFRAAVGGAGFDPIGCAPKGTPKWSAYIRGHISGGRSIAAAKRRAKAFAAEVCS